MTVNYLHDSGGIPAALAQGAGGPVFLPPPPTKAETPPPGVTVGSHAGLGLWARYEHTRDNAPEAREIRGFGVSHTPFIYDTCSAPQVKIDAPCNEHSLTTAIFQPWRWDIARRYLESHNADRPAAGDVDGWMAWAQLSARLIGEMKAATNLYHVQGRHTGWNKHTLVPMGIQRLEGLDQPDGVPRLDGVVVPLVPFRQPKLAARLQTWRAGALRSGVKVATPWSDAFSDAAGILGRVCQWPIADGLCQQRQFPLRDWLMGEGKTVSAKAFWFYNTRGPSGSSERNYHARRDAGCRNGRHDGHEVVVLGFELWKQWQILALEDALDWDFSKQILAGMDMWFTVLTPFVTSGGLDLDVTEWRRQQDKLRKAHGNARTAQVASASFGLVLTAFSVNWIAGVVVLIAAVVAVFVTWLVGLFKRKHEPYPCPPPPFIRSLNDPACDTSKVAGNPALLNTLMHIDTLTPMFTIVPDRFKPVPPPQVGAYVAPSITFMVDDLPPAAGKSSFMMPALALGAGALVLVLALKR